MKTDGSDLQRLLPGWKTESMICCGDWSSDGRYNIFVVQDPAGTKDLWIVRDGPHYFGLRNRPVQLTSGPLWYSDPVFHPQMKRVFANGSCSKASSSVTMRPRVSFSPPSQESRRARLIFRPTVSGSSA